MFFRLNSLNMVKPAKLEWNLKRPGFFCCCFRQVFVLTGVIECYFFCEDNDFFSFKTEILNIQTRQLKKNIDFIDH